MPDSPADRDERVKEDEMAPRGNPFRAVTRTLVVLHRELYERLGDEAAQKVKR